MSRASPRRWMDSALSSVSRFQFPLFPHHCLNRCILIQRHQTTLSSANQIYFFQHSKLYFRLKGVALITPLDCWALNFSLSLHPQLSPHLKIPPKGSNNGFILQWSESYHGTRHSSFFPRLLLGSVFGVGGARDQAGTGKACALALSYLAGPVFFSPSRNYLPSASTFTSIFFHLTLGLRSPAVQPRDLLRYPIIPPPTVL